MKPTSSKNVSESTGSAVVEGSVDVITVPLMECRVEKRPDGTVVFKDRKWYQAERLRALAGDLLERALEADKEKDDEEYSDLVAVLFVLAASLECFLNDMLIMHAYRYHGSEYKAVAEGLLGGSIRSRILRIIPLVTRDRCRLDQGNASVGTLFELIKARNRIAHTTDYYEETPRELDEGKPSGKSITHVACVRYAEAVDAFFVAVLSEGFVIAGKPRIASSLVVASGNNRESYETHADKCDGGASGLGESST